MTRAFPFRTSVHDNLRALFAHDRLASQTNHLGYSSLSPGEGSFDILDAAGNAVAMYGHAAGRSGFLVPDGSGWQTVQEAITSAAAGNAARIGALEGRADEHARRIGAAETRLDDQVRRIGAVENRATALEGRADDHARRLGSVESRAGSLEGRADQHAARMGRNENDLQDIVNSFIRAINALDAEVAELKSRGTKPLPPRQNTKG